MYAGANKVGGGVIQVFPPPPFQWEVIPSFFIFCSTSKIKHILLNDFTILLNYAVDGKEVVFWRATKIYFLRLP